MASATCKLEGSKYAQKAQARVKQQCSSNGLAPMGRSQSNCLSGSVTTWEPKNYLKTLYVSVKGIYVLEV